MTADLTVFQHGTSERQPHPSWSSRPAPSEVPPSGPRFTGSLRRRWPVVIVTLLLGCLAGLGLGRVVSPTYSSATSVFLDPVPGNPLDTISTTNAQQLVVAMQTEANLVTSPDVLSRASRILEHRLAPGTPQVSATVPENTQIVRIQFSASTRRGAEAGAAALATAFLAHRSQQGVATRQRQLATLQKQQKSAQTHLREAIAQASAHHPPAGASARVQLATSRVSDLDQSIGTLQAEDVNPGSVVAPPSAPVAGMLGQPQVLVAGTGVGGLFLGLLVVAMLGRREDRRDRGQCGGVPVWGRVYGARKDAVPVDDLPADHPVREELRQVRASVVRAQERPCVLAVAPTPAIRHARDTAADLAMVLRDAGHLVAFVDASFEPAPDGLAEVATPHDLAELLGSRPRPGRSVVLGRWRRVGWLPGGDGLSDARDLLCGDQMSELLGRLRLQYDYVVIATPRASTAEARALGSCADLTLLMAPVGAADTEVEAEVAAHNEAGSQVRGVIGVSRERRLRAVRPKVAG